MRLLLDTQIFIWFAIGAPALRSDTRKLITDAGNSPCLSHISLFEIAIKQKIGKLSALTITIPQLIVLAMEHGFSMLPITADHIAAYERIPLVEDHRDPFDRLLLATALAENMPLLSSDGHFPQYAPLVSVIRG